MAKKTDARTCPRCKKRSLVRDGRTAGGKQRWICKPGGGDRPHCYSTTNPELEAPRKQSGAPEKQKPLKFNRKLTRSVVVITAAQNATPVHAPFMASLEQYCNHRSAELIAIPIMYKNPTSRWETAKEEGERWWDPRIKPYLINQRKRLNKNLTLLGDVPVQPTAVNPLTGFEGITHGESGILGHTKLALKTIPRPQGEFPKILTTTGAITRPNYSLSKAGKTGEFHHTLGAIVVEIVGSKFHMRQLGAQNNGQFYDLEWTYGADWSGDRPWKGLRPLGLVMGDTHVDAISPGVERATFGKGGIVDALEPRELIWHDLMEGASVSPHTRGNPFIDNARVHTNQVSVSAEIMRSLEFVAARTPKDAKSYIVPSNHNDWLHRWILATDWKTLDPDNRIFYLRLAAQLQSASARMTPDQAERLDAFTLFARQMTETSPRIHVLEYDESHMVGSIETGMHGHLGPNGARGSLRNLRRIGVKSVTGHEHSPGIDEGAWRVGTSTELRRGYNRGPSGWLQTHCLIYPNSKRTLINIIGEEWRA